MNTLPLPPGPKGRFFGLSLARDFADDPLKFITRLAREHGPIASCRMGPVRAVFVNHPDLIREVLVTKGKLFHKQRRTVDALRQVDGDGLVLTEGDLWLRQRRLLQPAFGPKRLGRYAEAIVERTRRFVDRWRPGQTVNMVDEMTHLTLEIIAKVFYDTELTGKAAQLGEAVRVLSQTFYEEVSYPIRLPDWLPIPSKRRKKWAIATLRGLINDFIAERRRGGEVDRGDLLSMLLLAVDEEGDGRGMSDRQAQDEAVTMFNAGHDSTAAALAWIWYLIARHPEVEVRLVDEARSVLGDRPATFDDVSRLTYSEMVVREALRLYPPVWALFAREVREDVELGGFRVPRGSQVFMFPWVTQRDPANFPDPLRFDPGRFSAERIDEIPQYAWLPFGAGPHICIGLSLALMEMTLIIPTILQRYRPAFAPGQSPEVQPEPLLASRPRGGLQMVLVPCGESSDAAGSIPR
jgi:cytochrome P450